MKTQLEKNLDTMRANKALVKNAWSIDATEYLMTYYCYNCSDVLDQLSDFEAEETELAYRFTKENVVVTISKTLKK